MKNKFQDIHHHTSSSSKERAQRINMYRQAWLKGKLKINAKRLAEKMLDFEQQIDSSLADTHTVLSGKNR